MYVELRLKMPDVRIQFMLLQQIDG